MTAAGCVNVRVVQVVYFKRSLIPVPHPQSLTRSTTANRAGSQHQVTSGSDDQGRTWKQETSSSVSATKTLSTTNRLDDNVSNFNISKCLHVHF